MVGKPLSNPKYERFAHLVVAGQDVNAIYESLGYSPNPCNARRLRHHKLIKARIEELMAEISAKSISANVRAMERTVYTRDMAMDECEVAMKLALEVKNPTGYVAAVTLRAKLSALLVERKEIGGPGDFEALSDNELRSIARDALAAYQRGQSSEGIGAAADQTGMPDAHRVH